MKDYKLDFIHLADGSSIDKMGKLTIFGIFDTILLKKVPSNFLKFTIVGKILLGDKIPDIINVEAKLIDNSKKELKPNPKIKFDMVGKRKTTNHIAFSIEIGNMRFNNYGKHKVLILVNGRRIGKKDFTVKESMSN